jgi:hypothetical protein
LPAINPCQDSLFLAFKAKPFKDLNDREYQYNLEKDRQCADY